jgi:hypothetical protein
VTPEEFDACYSASAQVEKLLSAAVTATKG